MSPDSQIKIKNGTPMLSAKAASKRMKCAPDYVSKLCRESKLDGVLVEGAWFVNEESIVRFEKQRKTARLQRSAELTKQRKQESAQYRMLYVDDASVPVEVTAATPTFAARALSQSSWGRTAALTFGAAFLFAAVVFAGGNSAADFFGNNNAPLAAAIAQVQSPFFGGYDTSTTAVTTSGSGTNFFDEVYALLFGGKSPAVKIADAQNPPAQATTVAIPTPLADRDPGQSVGANSNTPSTPKQTIVENNTYPVIEHTNTVVQTQSGVTQVDIDTAVGKLEAQLLNEISLTVRSIGTGGGGGGSAVTNVTNVTNQLFSATSSGAEGAIQFNASGAFAGDASNLFFDSVNHRLGIGTSTPATALSLGAGGVISITSNDGSQSGCFEEISGQLQYSNDCSTFQSFTASAAGGFTDTGTTVHLTTNSENVAIGTSTPYAKLTVFGNGTGGENAFEIANSASTTVFAVTDAGLTTINTLALGHALSIANGGTGTSTAPALGQLLVGNNAGGYDLVSTSSLGIVSGTNTTFGTTSIFATAPLNWNTANATLSIMQSGLAQNGFLSSADFNTFNNKISSSSLSGGTGINYVAATGVITNTGVTTLAATYPLITSGSTGALTISTAFSTTTANTFGALNTFNGGLFAVNASTTNATTTSFAITNVPGALLKTLSNGAVVAAVSGVDYALPGGASGAFPFTPTVAFGTAANATSTLIGFNAGLYALGSSTIANLTFANGTSTNLVLSNLFADSTGTTSVTGNLIPSATNTYTLGSLSNTWKEVYIGPGSLFVNGQEVLHTDGSNNVVVSSSINQNLVLQTTGSANIELNPSGTGQVLVKSGILLTGGKNFTTSDSSAVLFPNGVAAGNITVSGSAITANLLNAGIALTPNGSGNTYVTAGNFGIGTTSPTNKLEVNGASYLGGNVAVTGALNVFGSTLLANATTTTFAISNVPSALLKTLSNGAVVAAVANTDFTTPSALATAVAASYPFPGNATTTSIAFNGGLSGNLTGNVTGNVTGNASTATALQTGRTINGVTFDGTGNIVINAASSTLLANSNTFSALNVFNGGALFNSATTTSFAVTGSSTIGKLNLSTALAISSGGTGTSTAPTFGQLLLGNHAGGYDLVSTSSLGIVSSGGSSFAYPFPNNATSTLLSFTGGASTTDFTISSLGGSGTTCVQADASGRLSSAGAACGTGSGSVNTVVNSDGTLTITPTTGNVVASLNLGHANTFTALQQFNGGATFSNSTTTGNAYIAGNVGIGTNAPQVELDIPNSTSFNGIRIGNLSTGHTLDIFNDGDPHLESSNGNTLWINQDNLAPTDIGNGALDVNILGGVTVGNALSISNFTGILKATGGVVSTTTAGVDYEVPLSFAYPLSRVSNTIALSFGTTTANTFSQLQTYNGGLVATNATTTTFAISNVPSALLKTLSNGAVVAAVANTDFTTPSALATAVAASYPFPGNATTTSIAFNGGLSGNLTGNVTGNVTGNASTATALQTGRTINGVTFDGTGNIVITAASSTLLANSNTFLGSNTFNGNTTLSNATTTSFAITNVGAALLKTLSNGAVVAAVAGTDYLTSANVFAYPFPGNATTTQIAFNGGATFAGATTTNLAITGIINGLLATNGSGSVVATSSLSTNYFTQSSLTTSGFLSSTDFNTFNNKISSTSLSAVYPLAYNSSTGVFTTAFSTTTTNTFSALNTFNGGVSANTLAVTTSATLASTTLTGNTLLTNATTTSFAISNVSNALLKTLTNGSVVAAVAGTDYLTSANVFAYPFPNNATSTLIGFNGGIISAASSTFSGTLNASTTNISTLNLAGLSNAVLAVNSAGQVIGTTSIGVSNLSGTLSVAHGGTGSSTLGGILVGSSTNAVQSLIVGSGLTFDGTTLATNGAGITAIGPVGQTQTGGTQLFATSTAGSDFTITASGNTQTFNLPFASSVNNGKLGATDFSIFENKISSSSLSGQSVISYNSGSGVITTVGGTFGSGSYVFPNNVQTNGTSSVFNLALFGSTATSSFNSAGALTLASALGIASGGTNNTGFSPNSLLYFDGTKIAATSSNALYIGSLVATTTTATSTLNGGLAVANSLFVLQNGNIGIGNSTPSKTLDITGTARVSGVFTLGSNAACTGAQSLQTDAQGNVVCGTITISGASTGGGWTTNSIGSITLATSTDEVGIGATSTPYAKLSILSGGAGTTTLALVPASGQVANIIDIYNTGGSLSSVFTAGGSLGLGTTSPFATLSVNGNGFFTGNVTGTNITATGTLAVGGATLVTTSGGNVGIGTSSPTSHLALAGGNFTQTAAGNPTIATTVPESGANHAFSTYVSGHYAYVADNEGGLRILDVANPNAPATVGLNNSYTGTPEARDVVVSGKYAYVADQSAGLEIFDVSNTSAPSLVGSFALSGSFSLAVSGKYVYIVDQTNHATRVIDVSNPSNPTLAGSFTSTAPQAVAIQGKYLYLADNSPAIDVLDITNPAKPILAGTYTNPSIVSSPLSIYVSGAYIFVADEDTGMYALNITNPATPTLAGRYPASGTHNHYTGVQVAGVNAYVSDHDGNVLVVDISKISSPSLVGSVAEAGTPNNIFVAGKYAYISDNDQGLDVVDINGITSPAANIGSLAVSTADISDNLNVGGDAYFGGGINAGVSGIFSRGGLSVFGTTTLQNFTANNATTSQATTTNLAITGIINGLLATNGSGSVVATSSLSTNYFTQSSLTTSGFLSSTDFNTFNNKISSTSLSAVYPLAYNSSTGVFTTAFSTTTANTFSALNTFNGGVIANAATTTSFAITNVGAALLKTLSNGAVVAAVAGTDYLTSATTFAYPFPGNATSTQIAFNGGATFSNATSTGTFAVTGSTTLASLLNVGGALNANGTLTVQGTLTLGGLSNALLYVNGAGQVAASSSINVNLLNGTLGVANGGTGSTTLGGILTGNGTGALTAATIAAPLTFSGNTLAINQATLSQNGFLSSADFTTFNNKISSSSLSAVYPLAYNSSTGIFTTAFSTTTANTFSALNTFNGGVIANAATTTALAVTGSSTISGVFNALGTDNLGTVNATSFTGAGTGLTGTAAGLSIGGNAATVTTNANLTGVVTSVGNTTSFGSFTSATLAAALSDETGSGAAVFGTGASLSNTTLASTTLTGSTILQNATTTSFAISNVGAALLKTLSNGAVVAAIAGTDYLTSATTFAYPFPASATSSLIAFNGGLTTTGATSTGTFAVTGSTTLASLLNIGGAINANGSLTVLGGTSLKGATSTSLAVTGSTTITGQLNAFGGATFGSATVGGTLTLGGLSNALLYVNSSGQVAASTSVSVNYLTGVLPVPNGGTGSTTLGGILTGNGTGSVTAAAISAPLTFSGNILAINQATLSQNGFLSSTDFTTFNNKISSTSLSAVYPLAYNSGTGVFTTAFSTTTANTFSGLNTFNAGVIANAATTTNFAVTSVSGQLLKTLSDGAVVAAVAGTDYLTSATTFAYPFPGNATSTQIAFNGGATFAGATTTALAVNGSTTITGVLNALGISNLGTVNATSFTGAGTGLTGTAAGLNIGGNANTATTLQTSRNINGVAFNGSADITVTAAAGTLTGTTLNSTVTASSLTSVGTLTALTVSGNASLQNATSTSEFTRSLLANVASFGQSGTSTFTSAGFLGIGSTSPFANLSIHANNGATNTTLFAIGSSTQSATTTLFSVDNTGNATAVKFTVSGSTNHLDSTGLVLNNSSALFFNGTQAFTNGGIGFLDINSTAAGNIGVRFFANGLQQAILVGSTATAGTAVGNFGLGTTTPFAKLSVVGDIFATGNITGSNITATGTLSVTGNTTLASATSTTFAITGISGQLLKTLSDGAVVAAVAGTDYAPAGADTFAYPFPASATSSLIAFNGGLTTTGATSTGTFAVTGSTTLASLLNVGGSLNANGSLTVLGGTSLKGATSTSLAVTGSTTVSGAFNALSSNLLGSTTLLGNSLFSFATTTNFAITGTANTLLKTLSNGAVVAAVAGTDYLTAATTFAYPFSNNATSTLLNFNGGLTTTGATSTGTFAVTGSTTLASLLNIGGALNANGAINANGTLTVSGNTLLQNATSTNFFATTASTTNLTIGSVLGSLLKTTASGQVVAAIAGVDYATAASAAFPFTPATFGSGHAANSTSTLIGFTNGLYALASSTIGDGTQAGGLTVNGGATTTGNQNVLGNSTVTGNSTVGGALTVKGTATSTFAGAVSIGTTTPPANAIFSISSSSLMFMIDSLYGNVGIGTQSSNYAKLAVQATSGNDGMKYVSTIASSTVPFNEGLALSGNYLYTANNNQNNITVVNVTDAANPVFAGEYASSTATMFDPFVSGTHLYTQDDGSNPGFDIFDISSPTAPALVGIIATSTSDTPQFVSGNFLYFVDSVSNLEIYNVTTPSSPVFASAYATSSGLFGEPYVSGNFAYVNDGAGKIEIINISSPTSPTFAGLYSPLGGGAEGSPIVSGNFMYVSDQAGHTEIVNIANPAAPVLAGTYTSVNGAGSVEAVQGSLLLVQSNDGKRIEAIDISNPAAPVMTDVYSSPSGSTDAEQLNSIAGNYFYTYSDEGIEIVDISGARPSVAALFNGGRVGINTANPLAKFQVTGNGSTVSLESTYTSPTTQLDGLGFVSGNYYYNKDNNSAIEIVNVSNPAAPVYTGTFASSSTQLNNPFVDGTTMYVNDSTLGGIELVNISNPAAPAFISSIGTTTGFGRFTEHGGMLYAIDNDGNLEVYNVSNPSAPSFVGMTPPGFLSANSDFIGGDFNNQLIYVLDSSHSLVQIDVSDPTAPFINPSYTSASGGIDDFTVDQSTDEIFVLNENADIEAIDRGLSLDSTYHSPSGGINKIAGFSRTYNGTYLFADNANQGVDIINISDTTQPSLVDTYSSQSGDATNVFISGTHAYVENGNSALEILDLSGLITPSLSALFSGGYVGIGTNSPLAQLDVNGGLAFTGTGRYINFDAAGSGVGAAGYGLRDNGGTLQYKNSGGDWSGFSIVDDNENTFAGDNTFISGGATGGHNNIAFGNNTLVSNTSIGAENIALGSSALDSNTDGADNIAIGRNTLSNSTTDTDNTAVGDSALQVLSSGGENVAFGSFAGNSLTSGQNNSLFGNSAGENLTSGDNNIAIGDTTDFLDSTGSNQLNIGNTLYGDLSTGEIGLNAGTHINFGFVNGDFGDSGYGIRDNGGAIEFKDDGGTWTALGGGAAVFSTDLSSNIFSSNTTMNAITSGVGISNFAAGGSALISDTDGQHNIAIDNNALTANLTGSNNIALGNSVLQLNTSGSDNIGFGSLALGVNVTGSHNVALGLNALENSTGDNNLGFGEIAGSNLSSGDDNIAIGVGTNFLNSTGSNQLNIGNILYGDLSAGDIGLNAGAHINFNVASEGFGDSGYGIRDNGGAIEFKDDGGTWTAFNTLGGGSAASSTLLTDVNTFSGGTLTITDGAPTAAGTVAFGNGSNSLNFDGSNFHFSGGGAVFTDSSQFIAQSGSNSFGLGSKYNAGDGAVYFGGTDSGTPDAVISNTAGTELARFTDAGNVGIGTSSPFAKFSIQTNNGDTATTLFAIGSSTQSATTTLFSVDNTGNANLAGIFSAATFNASGASTTLLSLNGQSFFAASSTNNSIFFGFGAGTTTLLSGTGINNFGVGPNALQANTTGSNNIAIGGSAGFNNTTGNFNNFFGLNAGKSNTTGASNTFFGFEAGLSNTTGDNNNFFGNLAGFSNVSGSNNNILGKDADASNTTGSNNDFIGNFAGFSNTTGYSNTILGDNSTTNTTLTTGFGNLGLGSNIFFADPTANRQLNLGGILFGNLPATTTGFQLPTSGSIGVGTSSPFAKFSIQTNNGDTASVLFAIGSSTQSATTTLFRISNTGNSFLSGIASTTGLIVSNLGASAGQCLTTDSSGTVISQSCSGAAATFPFAASALGNSTSTLLIDTAGIIASASSTIGNGTQTGGLTVSGGATTTGNALIAGTLHVGTGAFFPSNVLEVNGQTFISNANLFTDVGFGLSLDPNGTNNARIFSSAASADNIIFQTNNAEAARFISNGNLGLGTTTPYSTLSVVGTTTSTGGFDVDGTTNLLSYLGSSTISVFGTRNFFAGIGANGSTTKTTGTDNVFIGNGAGYGSTGTNNTFVGSQSGTGANGAPNSTSGNTGVGAFTLNANSTGATNSAFGSIALQHNTTGGSNDAFGAGALATNISGSNNDAFGASALLVLSTGSSNSVFGSQAASGLTGNSSSNVAIGASALGAPGAAQGNTIVGYAAGALGNYNTGLGFESAFNAVGDQNTLLGYTSGYNVSTGFGNIGVGASSTANITTGGNNIGIGNNTYFASATANNQLNIGNLIFGSIPATTTGFALPTSGAVGIGTSSPFAKFSIQTNRGDTATVLFAIGSSTQSATTTLFSISNTGNSFLKGTASSTNVIISSLGASAGQCLTTDSSGNVISQACSGGGGGSAFPFNPDNNFGVAVNSTSTPIWFTQGLMASSTSYLSNLVLGSTTPQSFTNAPLVVAGNANSFVQTVLQNTNSGSLASADFIVGGDLMTNSAYYGDLGYNSSGNADPSFTAFGANDLYLYNSDGSLDLAAATSSNTAAIKFFTGGSATGDEAARITAAGNFGIGTTSPYAELSVFAGGDFASHAASTLFAIGSSTAGHATTTIFAVNSNGNVGVGTTTPFAKLSIQANTGDSNPILFGIGSTTSGTASANLFQVTSNGRVGIGTTSPFAQLSVFTGGTFASQAASTLFAIGSSSKGTATTTFFTVNSSGLTTFTGIGSSTVVFGTNLGSTTGQLNVMGGANISRIGQGTAGSGTSGGTNGTFDIAVQGHYAYAADNGFQIWDVTNPATPTVIASTTPGTEDAIVVQGRYAYTSNSAGTTEVWDVSNPATPIKVGSISQGSDAIYLQGRYLYLADATNLRIIDVLNPSRPVLVASSATTNSSVTNYHGLFVQGKYAYVAEQGTTNSFEIFDISNPTNIVRVSRSALTIIGDSVYVQGNYAYLNDTNAVAEDLEIWNISNPAAPVKVSVTATGIAASFGNITVQGRYAYIVASSGGGGSGPLLVYDVSNPVAPVLVASKTLNGPSVGIAVQGRYAYISSGFFLAAANDFEVWDLGGEYAQQLEAGSIQASSLSIDNNLSAQSGIFSGSINAAGNSLFTGSLNVTGSTFNAPAANQNFSLFSVGTASSTNAILTALYNGNVGVGTTSTFADFAIQATSTNTTVFVIGSTTAAGVNSTLFSVSNTGSTTIANGININSGCYAIGGTCLAFASLTALNTFAALQTFSGGATTTALTVTGVASTSDLVISNLNGTGGTAQCLQINTAGQVSGTGSLCGSGAGSTVPAGPTNAVQFNSGGVFGGSANLTFDGTNLTDLGAISAGTLSVGSTTPFAKISIQANNGDTFSTLFAIGSSTQTATTTLFSISNTGQTTHIIPNLTTGAFTIGTSTAAQPAFSISTPAGVSVGGLVGIATSSPWGKLAVEMGSFHPSFVVSNQGSSTSAFIVSGANQDGRVGVATSSPFATFSVGISSNSATEAAFAVGKQGSSTLSLYVGSANQNGFVGIGTTTNVIATSSVLVVGNSSIASGRTIAVFSNAAGAAYISNTAISFTSDQRLKKNITDLPSVLSGVLALQPVTYNLNSEDDSTPVHTGFIAQQVQPIFPDLVTQNDQGFLALNYGGLTPYLASAIQAQQQEIVGIASSTATFPQIVISNGAITLGTSATSTVTINAGIIHYSNPATTTIAIGTNVWTIATSSATGTIPIIAISAPASSTPSVSINGNLYLNGQDITSVASTTATTTPAALASGPFASATAGLKAALDSALTSLQNIAQLGVRNLGAAVYATVGTFNNLFATNITATDITADTVTAAQKLCIGSTCVTETQLQNLLNGSVSPAQAGGSGGSNPPQGNATSTPPTITVNGNNPATLTVGDIYDDLGATATDNQGTGLGVHTFVNGLPLDPVIIDTSSVATDTIDYVATDTWGNTSTSSRTVIIQ